jgi:hypothetical protein
MAGLTVENARIAGGAIPDEGRLIFYDGALVAVLIRLEPELAAQTGGVWYLQAGFGTVEDFHHPSFPSIDDGLAWLSQRLSN